MTRQTMNQRRNEHGMTDIIATDEAHPSIARQIFNGVSGTLVLLVMGIIMLALVLWKSP